MAKRYWLCSKCGVRNERIKQKCGCGRSRPKARVAAHARTLRDDSYEAYLQVARDAHGVTDESCCVCGKPRSQERRHDRDHGHNRTERSYGKPRGVACVHCNKHMPVGLTLELARLIVGYLQRVDDFYALEDAA